MSFDMIAQRYTIFPTLLHFPLIYLFANGNIMQTCGAIRHLRLACPKKIRTPRITLWRKQRCLNIDKANTMEYITLKGGDKISRIGLGTSRLTPDKEGCDTVLKAVDSGINQINCADFYNSGDGELAVRGALRQHPREDFFISVKFGALMTLDHPGMTGIDVAPEHVENYLAYTLHRLGTDYIDLYQPGRINPHIPLEDTLGAIEKWQKKGYIKHIGLTQVDGETLRKANEVTSIDLVELNYNVVNRRFEDITIPEAQKLGIPVCAFGVMQGLKKDPAVLEGLQKIADKKGGTLAQLSLAWVLAQDKTNVAIMGSHHPEQAESAAAAVNVHLTQDDLAAIERIIPKAKATTVYMPDIPMDEKGIFDLSIFNK